MASIKIKLTKKEKQFKARMKELSGMLIRDAGLDKEGAERAIALLAEAKEVAGKLVSDVKMAAIVDPDKVYVRPLLLFSAPVFAFGEAEDVAAIAVETGAVETASFQCFDVSHDFAGATAAEIAARFRLGGDALGFALMCAAASILAVEDYDEATAPLVQFCVYFEDVFELIGAQRKLAA